MITILCALGLAYYGWVSAPPQASPEEKAYKGAVMVAIFCTLNIISDLIVYATV